MGIFGNSWFAEGETPQGPLPYQEGLGGLLARVGAQATQPVPPEAWDDPAVQERLQELINAVGVPAFTRIPGAIEELVKQLGTKSPSAVRLALLEKADAARMNTYRQAGARRYAEGDPLMATPEYIRHIQRSRMSGLPKPNGQPGDRFSAEQIGKMVEGALFGTGRGKPGYLPPHTLDRATGEPLARRGLSIGYGSMDKLPSGPKWYTGILDIGEDWPALKSIFERLGR
jgi:hypothetical protein